MWETLSIALYLNGKLWRYRKLLIHLLSVIIFGHWYMQLCVWYSCPHHLHTFSSFLPFSFHVFVFSRQDKPLHSWNPSGGTDAESLKPDGLHSLIPPSSIIPAPTHLQTHPTKPAIHLGFCIAGCEFSSWANLSWNSHIPSKKNQPYEPLSLCNLVVTALEMVPN